MSTLNEIEKGQLCETTIEAFSRTSGGLRSFPGLLKKIIETKAWTSRVSRGKKIELKNLRELITSKPIIGWGEDPKKIEAVIKDHPEVLAMFREAMKEHGGDHGNQYTGGKRHNITVAKRGTNKAYTCERLKRDSPELFKEVEAGRMSANAAAIAAGIRKKPTPEDTCLKAFSKVKDRVAVAKEILGMLTQEEVDSLLH